MKIVDMHCDTISREHFEKQGLLKNDFQIDLHKMKEAGYLLQNFALFVNAETTEDPMEAGLLMADMFHEEMAKNRDLIRPVTTYEEIMENEKQGLMSGLLTLEEGEICKGNVRILRDFYRLGVRRITLSWNHPNSIGMPNNYKNTTSQYGEPDMTGLTEQGLAFIAEMERLGMIIDVSHLSDGGFYDVLNHTSRPFVASHSNARALAPHCRNLTDDMIRKMGERGCVTGLNYYKAFLSPYEDKNKAQGFVTEIAQHARHIANVGGIEVLALGSDFDGCDNDFADCSQMHLLEAEFKKQGFTSSEIDKIFYQNVLNVYKEILSR